MAPRPVMSTFMIASNSRSAKEFSQEQLQSQELQQALAMAVPSCSMFIHHLPDGSHVSGFAVIGEQTGQASKRNRAPFIEPVRVNPVL